MAQDGLAPVRSLPILYQDYPRTRSGAGRTAKSAVLDIKWQVAISYRPSRIHSYLLSGVGCLSDIESTFNVNDAEIAQPLCTAVQIGLVQLLAQWNIFPVVTVGHSSGRFLWIIKFLSVEI